MNHKNTGMGTYRSSKVIRRWTRVAIVLMVVTASILIIIEKSKYFFSNIAVVDDERYFATKNGLDKRTIYLFDKNEIRFSTKTASEEGYLENWIKDGDSLTFLVLNRSGIFNMNMYVYSVWLKTLIFQNQV